ncbi:MAG: flagellar biosynthetic protein FliO [Desulfobacterales bacterium]|nr:flagellar biosynthetic protein FliO [Desulfobacterales bacterium]
MTESTPSLWMTGLQTAGMFLLIIGILLIVLFLIKRLSTKMQQTHNRNLIRHLSTYYLTPKDRVVLLDVLGEKILIGVTPQSITQLTVINRDIMPMEHQPSEKTTFFNLFKQTVSRQTDTNETQQT